MLKDTFGRLYGWTPDVVENLTDTDVYLLSEIASVRKRLEEIEKRKQGL